MGCQGCLDVHVVVIIVDDGSGGGGGRRACSPVRREEKKGVFESKLSPMTFGFLREILTDLL